MKIHASEVYDMFTYVMLCSPTQVTICLIARPRLAIIFFPFSPMDNRYPNKK